MQPDSAAFTARSEVSGAAPKPRCSRGSEKLRGGDQNEDARLSFGVNFFLFCMKMTRKRSETAASVPLQMSEN